MLPFEGIFGDTVELRLIEFFMVGYGGVTHSIDELAYFIDIPADRVRSALKPLIKWEIVIPVETVDAKHQTVIERYAGNDKSIILGEVNMLNNVLIDMMMRKDLMERTDEQNMEPSDEEQI